LVNKLWKIVVLSLSSQELYSLMKFVMFVPIGYCTLRFSSVICMQWTREKWVMKHTVTYIPLSGETSFWHWHWGDLLGSSHSWSEFFQVRQLWPDSFTNTRSCLDLSSDWLYRLTRPRAPAGVSECGSYGYIVISNISLMPVVKIHTSDQSTSVSSKD